MSKYQDTDKGYWRELPFLPMWLLEFQVTAVNVDTSRNRQGVLIEGHEAHAAIKPFLDDGTLRLVHAVRKRYRRTNHFVWEFQASNTFDLDHDQGPVWCFVEKRGVMHGVIAVANRPTFYEYSPEQLWDGSAL